MIGLLIGCLLLGAAIHSLTIQELEAQVEASNAANSQVPLNAFFWANIVPYSYDVLTSFLFIFSFCQQLPKKSERLPIAYSV